MAFDGELVVYSSNGLVRAHTTVFSLTSQLYETAGEFTGPNMDQAIREEYSAELAAKLIGKGQWDRVDDDPITWDSSEEPRPLDVGFFLYASEIDWDAGILKSDWIDNRGDFGESIFPSDDLFGTEFHDARSEFEAEAHGLSFSVGEIELLLPNFDLRPASGFVTERTERKRNTGRPPKWDWEGAIAYIVSQAQLPDGLPTGPGAQARIEELISGWFADETGDSPSSSQVRQRAAAIMRMIEKPETPKIQ